MHFSSSFLTTNSQQLVDQSSPDLFRRTQKESIWKNWLSDFRYLEPFRRYSRSKSEVVKIDQNFACFWPPDFFGGGPAEFLDLDYKIQTVFDHVAKFQGDRPRDLGERVAKE